MKNSKLDIENLIQNSDLTNLTKEELDYLKKCLSKDGSNYINALWDEYEEIPVDFYTFLTDDRYLGKSTHDNSGNLTVFKFWSDLGNKLFSDNSKVCEVILSGATSIGKTTAAILYMLYKKYKVMCLKNPHDYYRLTKGTSLAVVFFNLTLDLSAGVGWKRYNEMQLNSPWFLERGMVVGDTYPRYICPSKGIEDIIGSSDRSFLGYDVFIGMMDELNFSNNKARSLQENKIMGLYQTVKVRMHGRFGNDHLLLMASSKRKEDDFLELYTKEHKNDPTILVVDEPQWAILKDRKNYSGKTFKIAVGNMYYPSKIIEKGEDYKDYENNQQVIDVPIEEESLFRTNLDRSLIDIAGVSLTSESKFFNMPNVLRCCKNYIKNAMTKEIIELTFKGPDQLQDYLDESLLPKLDRTNCYLHIDLSLSRNYTGIALHQATNRENTTLIRTVLYVSIKARKGEQVPYYKIKDFILYLRDNLSFDIVDVSTDSFQKSFQQELQLASFSTSTISTDTSLAPYMLFRDYVNKGDLLIPANNNDVLISEFEDVTLDMHEGKEGKIMKTDKGDKGHGDTLDAFACNCYKIHTAYNPTKDNSPLSSYWLRDRVNKKDDFGSESWWIKNNF